MLCSSVRGQAVVWGGPSRVTLLCFLPSPHNKLSIPPQVTSASGLCQYLASLHGFPGSSASEESTCNAGDLGLIPELGRSPGGGHGHPLPYACLENPHGQRSLAGFSPQDGRDSDTTEWSSTAQLHCWWNFWQTLGSVAWVILQTECVFPTLPPHSYAEALKSLVLGNAAFGRSGLNEVMRVGSQDGISALVCNKRNCPESSRQEPSWTEEKPHELTRRRRYLRWESQLSLDPESEAPRFQTLQTPEVWVRTLCYLSHSVCGILLQQPEPLRQIMSIILYK